MVMLVATDKSIYISFAELLEFPRKEMDGTALECISALQANPKYPEDIVALVEAYRTDISELSLDDLQGLYSYSFEMGSGDYSLDLGYHLYDGFKRANSLLSIKALYKTHGFPYDDISGGELPDNLPILLKFMDMVEVEKVKKDLREDFVIKSLEKLSKNFEKKLDSPFRHILKAVHKVIEIDVKDIKAEEKDKS
ncbi:MAG: hypothetical protein KAT46_00385 [Deltaproteobacteria bacterium]|nr:hypothetical protein [Deltaproteobacteria bacterium]